MRTNFLTKRQPATPHQAPTTVRALVAALALVAIAGCQSAPEPPKAPKRKNVILITLDGVRQDHLSAFGYFRPTSPNIDWLSFNGVTFRTVVPAGCSTRVSLTSLLTSKPYAHSQLENGMMLKGSNETLAEAFAAAGYSTAAFVASPILAAETNFGQGFEIYNDFADTNADYVSADLPIQAAVSHVHAQGAEAPPFFVHVHLQEPHPPWKHGSPWLTSEETSNSFFDEACNYIPSRDEMALIGPRQKENLIAKYDGALHFADEQIGALLAELRASGQMANTIIAVTTTHGIELLERFSAGHAYNPFDEVLRTFAIFFDQSQSFKDAIPSTIQPRIFDVGTTLMAMAGIDKPAGVQGIDLVGANQNAPDLAFAHCDDADVVRGLEYKLIAFDMTPFRMPGKRQPPQLTEGTKLYSLRSDPREQIDASESNPEQLAQMQSALDSFRAALGRAPATVAGAQSLKPRTRERLRVLGYEMP